MQILIWLTSNYWTTWRSTTRWTRTYEGLRGARLFHLVSLSLRISLTDLPGPCLGLCVGVACFVVLGCLFVGFFLLGKFDLNHMLIPVVDRPCLALVRQCRKKKQTTGRRAGSLSRPSSGEFRLKLNFAHQTSSCTCSQGALLIGLQLTTTLLYRHTPQPAEYAPYHSTLYPSNECELGTCRNVCSV